MHIAALPYIHTYSLVCYLCYLGQEEVFLSSFLSFFFINPRIAQHIDQIQYSTVQYASHFHLYRIHPSAAAIKTDSMCGKQMTRSTYPPMDRDTTRSHACKRPAKGHVHYPSLRSDR